MNRVERIFTDLRAAGRRGLMPFVCGGFPESGVTSLALSALEEAGASIIEVGIPFSDPIADGPVIAAAMHTALERGATPVSVFQEVQLLREHLRAGLIAMVSVSIVHRMGGADVFVGKAAASGFDGFIFPDAPLEESGELIRAAADAGLTASLLIAPTTPPKRAEMIVKACTGFVYLLARSGITGENAQVPEIGSRVSRLRQMTDLPIACGFGISTAEHVRQVTRHADAAIVGSAVVRRMSEAAARGADPASAAGEFVRELGKGLSSGAYASGSGSDSSLGASEPAIGALAPNNPQQSQQQQQQPVA